MKLVAFAVLACTAAALPAAASEAQYAQFKDPQLVRGRAVWLANCKACHASGVAGAPVVHDKAAWKPRVAKGRAVLHKHALEGFFGPMGTMMPARGGNDKLNDDDVKAAVDYMIAIVK